MSGIIREASDDSRYNLVRIAYAWLVRKLAVKIIAIGPQEFEKIGGRTSSKVVRVYNSLADSYFQGVTCDKADLRKRLGLPPDAFIYLSLGGVSFRKGSYQFVKSLEHLPDLFVAVLAGKIPDRMHSTAGYVTQLTHRLENILVSHGWKSYFSWDYFTRVSGALAEADNSRIVLAGAVNSVQDYIRACDVLVFPGTTPHSGRPVYEAWALKKPVIAFRTEVMSRDIDDRVDGLLTDHTTRDLADAIEWMRENPDLAEMMGEKGYRKAQERFSMKKNNNKIIEIYTEVLK